MSHVRFSVCVKNELRLKNQVKYLTKYGTEGKIMTSTGVIFFSTQVIFVFKKKYHKNYYFPLAKINGRTCRSCIVAQNFHAIDHFGYH